MRRIRFAAIIVVCWAATVPPVCEAQSSDPISGLVPGITEDEESGIFHGAFLGAYFGTYIGAFTVLAEGAGNGSSKNLPWIGAGLGLGTLFGAAAGYMIERTWPSEPRVARTCDRYDLIEPCPNQFQLQVENLSGFTLPGSFVNVREFQVRGSNIHFNTIGLASEQVPSIDLTYWLNDLDAIHLRFRYFDMGGTAVLPREAFYNGTTMLPGKINTTPFPWFAGGLYYERRFAPWYEDYQSNWPSFLQGWDLRGRMGLEYNYIYFSFDHSHAPVAPGSGTETAEDFYHQSMPLPTFGLMAYRRLDENFTLEWSIGGYWINRWNSLRSEGGTIWASQSGGEAHLRLFYANPTYLGPAQLMVGTFAYYYTQLEDSTQDGNYLQWGMAGLEYGLVFLF
jgi:hypothetical protein